MSDGTRLKAPTEAMKPRCTAAQLIHWWRVPFNYCPHSFGEVVRHHYGCRWCGKAMDVTDLQFPHARPTDKVIIRSVVTSSGTYKVDPPLICTVEETYRIKLTDLRRLGHKVSLV